MFTLGRVGWIVSFIASLLLTADPVATRGAGLEASVQQQDLDLPACIAGGPGGAQPATFDDVAGALGWIVPKYPGWTSGQTAASEQPVRFYHRLAFARPITLGTVYIPAGVRLGLLKPQVAYPGNPERDDDWETFDAPPRGGGSLVTLPPGTSTRALVAIQAVRQGRVRLQGLRLYAPRLDNVTAAAQAHAAEEYTPPNIDHPTNPASAVVTGIGQWQNAGKDQSGRVPRAPINELFPTWLLLAWDEPQTLCGLLLQSNFEQYAVEVFTGPEGIHPKAATSGEWRRLTVERAPVIPAQGKESWQSLSFAPVATRGLRLVATKTSEGQVATVSGLFTFSALGDAPRPTRSHVPIAAPVELHVAVPAAGNLTLGINGPDGRRVRDLIVRAPVEGGEQRLGWDLKDADGNFVPPGDYAWTALSYPDLRLRYEMTVYPNVTRHAPGNSPWLNALSGSGGWMADHSPPMSGCAVGERVYLGSYVAESGVSLIECDLAGQKLWGHHSFASWTGPQHLAANDQEVFIGATILGTTTESVWAVDHRTKQVRQVVSLVPTSKRPRGLRGMTVHGDRLYIACRGVESYLAGAASADDVDVQACVPFYPPARPPRIAYEIVPDPRNDFLRLFRLTGTPPGGATQFTNEYLRTPGSPGAAQHIVLAFRVPVALGSLAFPLPEMKGIQFSVSVLKPDAPFPPSPDANEQWLVLPEQARRAWDVIPVPPGTTTRAVRLTFAKGSADNSDPLAGLLDGGKPRREPDLDLLDAKKPAASAESALSFGGSSGAWRGQLEGMKLLRRRLSNVAGEAKIRVSSGKVALDGTWDAERTRPLSEEDPGIYLLEWATPQPLRGLAIKEIDGELTRIDVHTGPAGAPIDLQGNDGWESIGEYRQERRDHHSGFASCNGTARYLDGYIDFGREIAARAVRLRIVKQWSDNLPDARGIRADLGGQTLDPRRCRVFGIAALRHLGGEPPIDAAAFERIEEYDVKTGALVREIPLAQPGPLAVDPQGALYAVSGSTIVRVDLATGKHEPLVSDLVEPMALTFDRAGSLYVFENDTATRQVIVFDRQGKRQRTIGKPGGFGPGPWDAERLGQVTALAVDARDQLWAVEHQYHPKRVTVWSTAGQLMREHLGNTPYGGGGVLDPDDKSRLYYGPLEFELDWSSGLSRIKYLHWTGSSLPGEVPVVIDGRQYLVTRPTFDEQQAGIVYRYESGRSQLAAAMGQADAFPPLRDPALLAKLGNPPLAKASFLWCDLNEDGAVQADEVQLADAARRQGLTYFNRDLGVQAGAHRYRVASFTPRGVPRYEIVQDPKLSGTLYRLDDGGYYRLGTHNVREAVVEPDGSLRWSHVVGGQGGQALQNAKPWTRDQIVAQFGLVGHATSDQDGPGEFVVIHSNSGAWQVWTHDGLLVGPIFRDLRDPRARPWSMLEHERGMWLENVTSGQEHFHGYFCRTRQDGKYYVVAGHNHISIAEVVGFEQMRRLHGRISITDDDLERARAVDIRREQVAVYQRAPVIDAYRLAKPPAIDGRLTGWGPADSTITGLDEDYRSRTGAEFRIGYDPQTLYLAWRVRGLGPLKNTGEQFERLFKTGAAVDLHLAVDPAAPVDRQAPDAGDLRLLLTFVGDQPRAVLYRSVVPGADPAQAVRITSPTGEVRFDEIKLLANVKLARSGDDQQYTLEAAIPLSALGLKPSPDLRLKLDWGLLATGPDGNEVMRRIYWANQATQIIADAPSEARLQPHLWGHVRFHDLRPSAEGRLDALTGDAPAAKTSVDDLLDGRKPVKP